MSVGLHLSLTERLFLGVEPADAPPQPKETLHTRRTAGEKIPALSLPPGGDKVARHLLRDINSALCS